MTLLTITPAPTPLPDDADTALLERLRAAAALLESVAADRQLLDRLLAPLLGS